MTRAFDILILLEEQRTRVLYFGTAQQGMTGTVNPQLPQSRHRKRLTRPMMYATDNLGYAAGFTFPWKEQEGLGFGMYGRKGHYILTIPYQHLHRLEAPCSIYTVEGYFRRLRTPTPEYVTYQPVRIIDEKRYGSVSDCLSHNGVHVHVTQVRSRQMIRSEV